MTELLPDEETFIISKLPLESAQLRHKYPNAIWNAADCWDDSPLPANYLPNIDRIKLFELEKLEAAVNLTDSAKGTVKYQQLTQSWENPQSC